MNEDKDRGWEAEFDEYELERWGKWRIGRLEAKSFITALLTKERQAERERVQSQVKNLSGGLYYLCTYAGEHPYSREIKGFNAAIAVVLRLLPLTDQQSKTNGACVIGNHDKCPFTGTG